MTVPAIYSTGGYLFDIGSETSFNSGTLATEWGQAGIMAKFTNFEVDNAWTEAYQIGIRYPQTYYTEGLQTQANLEFFLCEDNIDWLQTVLSRSGTVAPYTYTVGSTVTSAMARLGTPQSTLYTIGGIAFTSAKFTITQAQAVTVALQGVGTSFAMGTIGSYVGGTVPTQLLTWKDCTIGSSTTATITPSLVQECDFTINTGAKMYYGLGSAQYQAFLPLQSQIQVNITAFQNSTDVFQDIYQLVTEGTVAVNMGTLVATFTGCYLTKGTMNLQPVQEVTDTISFNAINVSIV